jgi:hypothetical protein
MFFKSPPAENPNSLTILHIFHEITRSQELKQRINRNPTHLLSLPRPYLNFEGEIGVHWMWVSSQTSYFSTTRSICFLFTRRYVTTTTWSSPAIAANTSPVVFFQFILSELRGVGGGGEEGLGGGGGGGCREGLGGEGEGEGFPAMTGAVEGLELSLWACGTGEANEPPALIREDIHKMDIPTKILGWRISLGLNISGHKTPSNEFFCEQNSSDD